MMNLKNIQGVYQMSLPDPLIYFNILKGTLIRSSFFPQIKICIFFFYLWGLEQLWKILHIVRLNWFNSITHHYKGVFFIPGHPVVTAFHLFPLPKRPDHSCSQMHALLSSYCCLAPYSPNIPLNSLSLSMIYRNQQ